MNECMNEWMYEWMNFYTITSLSEVAATVYPSPQDTRWITFPESTPPTTLIPFLVLKSPTPSWPNWLQPKVIRWPGEMSNYSTLLAVLSALTLLEYNYRKV